MKKLTEFHHSVYANMDECQNIVTIDEQKPIEVNDITKRNMVN